MAAAPPELASTLSAPAEWPMIADAPPEFANTSDAPPLLDRMEVAPAEYAVEDRIRNGPGTNGTPLVEQIPPIHQPRMLRQPPGESPLWFGSNGSTVQLSMQMAGTRWAVFRGSRTMRAASQLQIRRIIVRSIGVLVMHFLY